MIVKENRKQLSFLFQETDSYFEMGYMILNQAKLSGMLPYKRTRLNEKEKLLFITEAFTALPDILPKLAEDEIIDILYAVVFMTQKVEENGFMKKECIWCRYENIYYDEETHKPLFAVLPITKEFRYADGVSWKNRFEETLLQIGDFLSETKKACFKQLVVLLKSDKISTQELLEKIDALGSGMSGLLVDRTEKEPDNHLELIYCGQEGNCQFTIASQDFVIGRNPDEVDGVLQISAKVSRKHCLITKINRNYFVQDLGSANGTVVNGTKIPPYELMQLEQNDVLSLADVDLRVKILL